MDREALRGRDHQPAASASELVQIQMNEQLIVELVLEVSSEPGRVSRTAWAQPGYESKRFYV